MSVDVLQNKSQIDQARVVLLERGLSGSESGLQYVARRLGIDRSIKVGDEIKSWDVLKTAMFVEEHVAKESPILDIGAYASEILSVLHRLGYSKLTGIDLNKKILRMPFADKISYVVSDFMQTPFESGSFKTITSVSVIEHGFNAPALLAEMSRLLRPGGYFIASFDYWPEKIDTCDTPYFGMDWKIFSKTEVLFFVQQAAGYGLTPCGELQLDAQERPVHCANRDYTFAWLAMKKSRSAASIGY